MPLYAVQPYDYSTNSNNFANVATGAIAGGLLGYASKFGMPLTAAEMDDVKNTKPETHAYLRARDEVGTSLKKNALFKTLDQDIFESIKKTGALSMDEVEKITSNLPKKGKDATAIIEKLQASYTKWLAKYSNFESWNLKQIRPSKQFVIAGGIAGFVAAVLHNIYRTDTNCC